MAEIDAKLVMQLRNRTGLSMMECKKALQEAGGELDQAEDLLRKKLKGKMDARTDRAAGQGRVGVAIAPDQSAAAIVELRAETDFTAKNEKFIAAASTAAQAALAAAGAGPVPPSAPVTAAVDELRITTGENCSYARGHKLAGTRGTSRFGSYVHHDGKTGVLVQAEGDVSDETLRQVCMHITAAVPRPQGVSAKDVPAAAVEKERAFRISQAMETGKPKEIAEKMVEGGMRKFFEEIALLEQPFVMDPARKIKDVVGAGGTIVTFLRWQVGEAAG
ncbi:MAG TPA: translation elongation factor Ts [Phycisphaerales bacterium]|nr:translation elongation factor Ts [Phycisphaerales bacterium]